MSKGTVTIILSDAARRAALLAGQPAEREQTYDIESPADIAAALAAGASVTEAGKCHLPWPRDYYYGTDFAPVRPTTTVEAIAANVAAKAGLAAKKATAEERDRKTAEDAQQRAKSRAPEWAALPIEWRIADGQVAVCRPFDSSPDYRGPLTTSGYAMCSLDSLKRYVPEAVAEASTAAEAWARAKTEAHESLEHMRITRLADLAVELGGETVRERVAAGPGPLGLLPEKEAREIIKGYLPDLPAYELITRSEVRESCTCGRDYPDDDGNDYDGTVSFRALSPAEAGGLTALEFEAFRAFRAEIEKVLPDNATIEDRVHVGECDGCPAGAVRRLGVKVTLDLGHGIEVVREYAV